MNTNYEITPNLETSTVPYFSDPIKFTKWLFAEIRPYIQGRVMEIGSGLGAFSSLLIEDQIPIHLSDKEEVHREALREKFSSSDLIRKIHNFDPLHSNFEKTYSSKFGVFGTLIAVNIVDWALTDPLCISNSKFLLRERGHLIWLLAAQTGYYDEMDINVEDLKRDNWPSIKKLLASDYDFMKARYFRLKGNSDEKIFSQNGLFVVLVARKIKN